MANLTFRTKTYKSTYWLNFWLCSYPGPPGPGPGNSPSDAFSSSLSTSEAVESRQTATTSNLLSQQLAQYQHELPILPSHIESSSTTTITTRKTKTTTTTTNLLYDVVLTNNLNSNNYSNCNNEDDYCTCRSSTNVTTSALSKFISNVVKLDVVSKNIKNRIKTKLKIKNRKRCRKRYQLFFHTVVSSLLWIFITVLMATFCNPKMMVVNGSRTQVQQYDNHAMAATNDTNNYYRQFFIDKNDLNNVDQSSLINDDLFDADDVKHPYNDHRSNRNSVNRIRNKNVQLSTLHRKLKYKTLTTLAPTYVHSGDNTLKQYHKKKHQLDLSAVKQKYVNPNAYKSKRQDDPLMEDHQKQKKGHNLLKFMNHHKKHRKHEKKKKHQKIEPIIPLSSPPTTIETLPPEGNMERESRNHHPDDFDQYIQEKTMPLSAGDTIRLEAIKLQILSKLGMKSKPNITLKLSREVIIETLYRAKETNSMNLVGHSEDYYNKYEMINNDLSSTSPAYSMYGSPPSSTPLNPYYAAALTSHHHNKILKESRDEPNESNEPDSEMDDFFGRTREIITFAEEGTSTLNGQRVLEFSAAKDVGASGQELKVNLAKLWIRVDMKANYERYRRLPTPKSLKLWVFRLNSSNFSNLQNEDFDRNTDMSAMHVILPTKLGWQMVDLTSTIQSWYAESSEEKLRLLIDCSGCRDQFGVHLFGNGTRRPNDQVPNPPYVHKNSLDPNRPFLVVHTDPTVMKRVRRRALDCIGAKTEQCCKQKFYVSFKDLGWDDWIIAPHGYYANYCRGECGTVRTPDSFRTFYSHVIEEFRKIDRFNGMQPCCAPLKFSSMSLIYFGPDLQIIKRDLPKMVVDECGCP